MVVVREIGGFGKLDQKNRLHIPKDIMELLRLDDNSDVYISVVLGEKFIRVYPREVIEKEIINEQ